MPIQLDLSHTSKDVALENVLLRGARIVSLIIYDDLDRRPLFLQLLKASGPSVERLHIHCDGGRRPKKQAAHEVLQDLPSLRQLYVSLYSIPVDRLVAPNLVHLALDETGCSRAITVPSILGALRNSPRLETLFISNSSVDPRPTRHHSPVSLPYLHSIELGSCEVRSDLVVHLQLPPNIAVGFRMLPVADVASVRGIRGDIPLAVVANMQHVLGRIDIRCITLAVPPYPQVVPDLLVRFEGLQASLEITTQADTYTELPDVFFGPRGILFSHSPRINNARELLIIGCPFIGNQVLDHINLAMPNIVSISFFHCKAPQVLVLPPQTNPSSPPFLHLERIMVLGPELWLGGMVKARRDCGVPIKTLIVGRGSGGFKYNHMEDYTALEEFVDDLRVGCPTEIFDWGSENEILNVWSAIRKPGPVSSFYGKLVILD